MIVLDRTSSSHTIQIIPKNYVPSGGKIFRVKVENEGQNTEVYNQTVSAFTEVDYYFTHTANLGLDSTKDQMYSLEITNTTNNEVLYRDRIFGTNQTAANYSINTSIYTTNTTGANDYLIYE